MNSLFFSVDASSACCVSLKSSASSSFAHYARIPSELSLLKSIENNSENKKYESRVLMQACPAFAQKSGTVSRSFVERTVRIIELCPDNVFCIVIPVCNVFAGV